MCIPKSHRARRRAYVGSCVLLAVLLGAVAPKAAIADGQVHLYYFFDDLCLACQDVHAKVLEPLIDRYGNQLIVDERDVAEDAHFELMLRLEEAHQVASPSIPEVFVGDDALIGPDEIRERLQERIEHYLAQGGVQLPAVSTSVPAPGSTGTAKCTECDEIHASHQTAVASKLTPELQGSATPQPALVHVAYFFQPGCTECDRAERDLQYVTQRYAQVTVRRFDVREEAALNQFLSLQAGVPADRQLTAPALFVGEGYLLGNEIRAPAIERLVQPYLSSGAAEPWATWQANRETAEQSILERFGSLGLWTVIGAGLLDGVNPCAFATMIFLVSYLSVRKRRGRTLLATGAAFSAGVFLAYLGVGLGLLRVLTALPILATIGRWVYGLTLVLCLVLAYGSWLDYRKAREGRLEDMSLKLPERLRSLIRRLIREGSRARNYVLASLLLGFAVSVVELACTGQVYLPTIIFVLGLPEWRTRAALALVVYNLMFVVPLIAVFLLVYYGTTSKQLTLWMNRHAATVKLGTTLLFVLMAGWLGYSLFFA